MNKFSQLLKNRRNKFIVGFSSILIFGLISISLAMNFNSVEPQTLPNGADASIFLYAEANGAEIMGSGSNMIADIDLSSMIEIDSLRGGVAVPIDPANGLPSGAAEYQPIVFTKNIDVASPLIAQSLSQSMNVYAEFHHFRTSSIDGSTERYFVLTLENGRFTSIRQYSQIMEDGTVRHMEEISLIFQTITWLYMGPDGTVEFQDNA